MNPEPVILSRSGGKDSALALYALQRNPRIQVVGLLTSVNGHHHRVSMHGLRETLWHQQVQSLGLPLHKIRPSEHSSNAEYEEKMRTAMRRFKNMR
ncbi:MAG: hypothetical protein KGK44_08555 [Gammaproteobacteria bacterium]|nr:hypothetical protein [Gammaproteobacteria bacterium]